MIKQDCDARNGGIDRDYTIELCALNIDLFNVCKQRIFSIK